MGVFFNGRLWVSPATMSVVDDSAMYNKNLSVGNVLAVIGKSEGGKPMTFLLAAANTKTVHWPSRLGIGLTAFAGLWLVVAMLSRVNQNRHTQRN